MALGVFNCVCSCDLSKQTTLFDDAKALFAALTAAHGDAVRYTLTLIENREQLADELCKGDKLDAVVAGRYPASWVQVRYDPARVSAEALAQLIEEQGWTVYDRFVSERHRLIA